MTMYSIRTETKLKQHGGWIFNCPQCQPDKIMNIDAVFPLTICGSSVVTYLCDRCGYRDDVLMD